MTDKNINDTVIEKIAKIMKGYGFAFLPKDKTFNEIAKAILEALPIEFVSRDSKPQEGDYIDWQGEDREVFKDNRGELFLFIRDNTYYLKDFPFRKITKHNNKPCVYIEDIGGSDDR